MTAGHTTTARSALVARTLEERADALRAFVSARLPASEVDDVLQIAAARVLERADALRNPERVVSWVYRVHRNAVTDALRTLSVSERRFDPSVASPDDIAVEADDRDTCACSLSQARELKPSYASILTLVDLGEYSLAEAARELGISVNNATVRLHRARTALRKKMLEHCGVSTLEECADCRCVHEGCCPA